MALIALTSTEFLTDYGHYAGRKFITDKYKKHDGRELTKDDTYICILSSEQPMEEELLRGAPVNILYESPLAVNLTPGHGREPRNKLFVFELK